MPDPKTMTISCELWSETTNTLHIRVDDRLFLINKSIATYNPEAETLTLPRWWAVEKGIPLP